MQTLYGKLKVIGGEDLKIWLDTEQLEQVDSDSLKHHVQQSLALLVCLSEEYLTAKVCLTELRTAYTAKIPIIVVCDGGVTEGTLDNEIKQFEAAKGEDPQGEDKETLEAMKMLRKRVLDQWRIEQKKISEPVEASGEIDELPHECHPVLWWSRDFVRAALKGVFQQLLVCSSSQKVSDSPSRRRSRRSDDPPGSPLKQSRRSDDPPSSPLKQSRRSDDPPGSPLKQSRRSDEQRLLFYDELLDRRKLHQISQPVSLFVSPHYPPDRSDELEQAFEERP